MVFSGGSRGTKAEGGMGIAADPAPGAKRPEAAPAGGGLGGGDPRGAGEQPGGTTGLFAGSVTRLERKF